MNCNCSNLLGMRNLQEQVKKAFCYQKLFWPFTVWINCSSDIKIFANSQPSASNFKSFSRSLEQFFLPVVQNNFGYKIQFFLFRSKSADCHKQAKTIWNEFGSHRESVKWRIARKVRIIFISLFFVQSYLMICLFFKRQLLVLAC